MDAQINALGDLTVFDDALRDLDPIGQTKVSVRCLGALNIPHGGNESTLDGFGRASGSDEGEWDRS